MHKLTLAAAVVGTLACASLSTSFTVVSQAAAAESFSFSFNTGDVAFAYSDGYWDRGHQWHSWRSARESREYRNHYSHNYNNSKHTKVKNKGWRGDQDHDGVPNSVDRDRDGDGTPNNRDDKPKNKNRD